MPRMTALHCVQGFGGHVFAGPCARCGTKVATADTRMVNHFFTAGRGHLCEVCGLVAGDDVHKVPQRLFDLARKAVEAWSGDGAALFSAMAELQASVCPGASDLPPRERDGPCRGFVPRHGFGRQLECASCGGQYEAHVVVVQ